MKKIALFLLFAAIAPLNGMQPQKATESESITESAESIAATIRKLELENERLKKSIEASKQQLKAAGVSEVELEKPQEYLSALDHKLHEILSTFTLEEWLQLDEDLGKLEEPERTEMLTTLKRIGVPRK